MVKYIERNRQTSLRFVRLTDIYLTGEFSAGRKTLTNVILILVRAKTPGISDPHYYF
jgi:hypothetical protein